MTSTDRMRAIVAVAATQPATLDLRWSDGAEATLDLGAILRDRRFRGLRDPAAFARAERGDWGHSVVWPSGEELSAETLWLESLTATGRDDTRRFLEWRLRNGLSLSGAAEALGVSRRMVAYYANGEKRVPRPILLACIGWEVGRAA